MWPEDGFEFAALDGPGVEENGATATRVSGWWLHGSEYLGRRVRRAVFDEEDTEVVVGAGDGEIVGWLPKESSEYVHDVSQQPVAAWHVVYYEDAFESIEEEDLDEDQVVTAIQNYQTDRWKDLGEDSAALKRTARRHQNPDTLFSGCGVHWSNHRKRWRVFVDGNEKRHRKHNHTNYVGSFTVLADARKAYDEAVARTGEQFISPREGENLAAVKSCSEASAGKDKRKRERAATTDPTDSEY
jgi:hypothetical protein